jgi:hypothetical protein
LNYKSIPLKSSWRGGSLIVGVVVMMMMMMMIETRYGLDDYGSRVRFSVGAGNFSLHHRIQTGSGAHPASYRMGTRGYFLGGKTAEA